MFFNLQRPRRIHTLSCSAQAAEALAMAAWTEPNVYHERQTAALCGCHALNTLVQAPLFGPVLLAGIAAELDARVRLA